MLRPDTFKIVGRLTIRVLEGDGGRELDCIDIKNLVVNGSKQAIAELLVNSNVNRHQVWAIGAGDGTSTPTVADTGLEGTKTFKKKYTSRTGSSGGLVEIQTTFTTTEGNVLATGEYFTEAALFTRGDVDWDAAPTETPVNSGMLARQLHAPIHKDSSISLEYTWRFQLVTA